MIIDITPTQDAEDEYWAQRERFSESFNSTVRPMIQDLIDSGWDQRSVADYFRCEVAMMCMELYTNTFGEKDE